MSKALCAGPSGRLNTSANSRRRHANPDLRKHPRDRGDSAQRGDIGLAGTMLAILATASDYDKVSLLIYGGECSVIRQMQLAYSSMSLSPKLTRDHSRGERNS